MENIIYNCMNSKILSFNNNSNINDIVFVTAFFNIGRTNWKNSSRSENFYLESFKKILNNNKKIIAFIDEKYINIDFIQNYIKIHKMKHSEFTLFL